MGSRRILKGIASGLAGSFISRNNDVGGYWALGRLCAKFKEVEIDLLRSSFDGLTEDQIAIGQHYSTWLRRQLQASAIPDNRLSKAVMSLRFNLSMPDDEWPARNTRGSI